MEQQRPERAHYRIQYPVNERPRLLVAGREYEVLNCSEKGVGFLAPGTLTRSCWTAPCRA
ncbi:MAG TPA: hypothetical protein VIL18_02620 [Longimicrobiales bacterium]